MLRVDHAPAILKREIDINFRSIKRYALNTSSLQLIPPSISFKSLNRVYRVGRLEIAVALAL